MPPRRRSRGTRSQPALIGSSHHGRRRMLGRSRCRQLRGELGRFTHRWRNTFGHGISVRDACGPGADPRAGPPTPVPRTIISRMGGTASPPVPHHPLINPGALRDTLEGEAAVVSDAGTLKPVVRGRVGARCRCPRASAAWSRRPGTQRARLVLTADAPTIGGPSWSSVSSSAMPPGSTCRWSPGTGTSGPLITTPSELLRGPHRIQTFGPLRRGPSG